MAELDRQTLDTDMVNHPPHYNDHPSGVECITIVEHFSFNIGNAIKYLWRQGLKGDSLEDLEKAAWYIQREMNRLYPPTVVPVDKCATTDCVNDTDGTSPYCFFHRGIAQPRTMRDNPQA